MLFLVVIKRFIHEAKVRNLVHTYNRTKSITFKQLVGEKKVTIKMFTPKSSTTFCGVFVLTRKPPWTNTGQLPLPVIP